MKLKIDNEALAEEFFEDSVLLGIVAPIKDYQFSWQLNQLLGLGFRVNNDIEIQLTKKQRKYFFSIYEYNNENDGEYLLPEFKHLDFLWLIKGDPVPAEELKALILSIRSLPGVQLVNEMTNEKIKHKQHLIF
jgi:hypothetical protein